MTVTGHEFGDTDLYTTVIFRIFSEFSKWSVYIEEKYVFISA